MPAGVGSCFYPAAEACKPTISAFGHRSSRTICSIWKRQQIDATLGCRYQVNIKQAVFDLKKISENQQCLAEKEKCCSRKIAGYNSLQEAITFIKEPDFIAKITNTFLYWNSEERNPRSLSNRRNLKVNNKIKCDQRPQINWLFFFCEVEILKFGLSGNNIELLNCSRKSVIQKIVNASWSQQRMYERRLLGLP